MRIVELLLRIYFHLCCSYSPLSSMRRSCCGTRRRRRHCRLAHWGSKSAGYVEGFIQKLISANIIAGGRLWKLELISRFLSQMSLSCTVLSKNVEGRDGCTLVKKFGKFEIRGRYFSMIPKIICTCMKDTRNLTPQMTSPVCCEHRRCFDFLFKLITIFSYRHYSLCCCVFVAFLEVALII